MTTVWTVIGVAAVVLTFITGFGWGSAWEQRRQLDRRFRAPVVDDEADERREPWPFGSATWFL